MTLTSPSPLSCQLERTPVPARVVPQLDDAQRRVVEHPGGPLLVLAGPGTGKTTTLVEAVAARVARGTPLDAILVLTFSRKAAAELRDRITARLGVTTASPSAWTFHAFCYALLRTYGAAARDTGEPLRLLSAPEQDVMLRELLQGARVDGTSPWPGELAPALDTHGFAEEVRALFARTRELGLEPADLAALGDSAGRPVWRAAARFLDTYLDVLDAQGAIDYAELVHRAVLVASEEQVRSALRGRYAAVFVDEYQDTDPAQERLLRLLAGDGRDLVVVGDPDQSIYAFRGAEVTGLLEFPERFRRLGGAPARVVTLTTSRRAGRRLLAGSRSVASRLPMPGLPVDVVRAHRALGPADGLAPGRVDVLTFPTPAAELTAVADLLRRGHLEHDLPWSSMAVLVRSGARSIPALRRVLVAAGVPVEVAGDELPLAREPAVAPLLQALRVVADAGELTEDVAHELLLSPLGGADASDLRRLARALREQERARLAGGGPDAPAPRRSAELVRASVADPGELADVPAWIAAPARRLARLLGDARRALETGQPEDVLWTLWSGTPWPDRLERAALAGGSAGRAADRDVDAVLALFEAFGRAEERRGRRGLANILAEIEAQQIPADTLAERPTRGAAVRLLTAHRAKGLEWDLVVVPGVQENSWPDLRRRGSLLEPDRLGAEGLREPATSASLLAEERRLFYVACTRARQRLVVTAVASLDDDGERPSRFLSELGVTVRAVTGPPERTLSLTGLVAELRRVAVDPAAPDELRRAAAVRLARLAAERREDGRPLVPAAHPDAWWGLAELTAGAAPIVPDRPVPLSGTVLQTLSGCPAQWLFRHAAHGETLPTTAMGFGGALHQLADDVAARRSPADVDTLMTRLDRVWSELAFEAPWESERQRDQARAALERFCRWHAAARGRELLATELEFRLEVDADGVPVQLRGRMDRVERADDGRVHVADLKTGRSAKARAELAGDAQLGVYQLAVRDGAVAAALGAEQVREPGGAELVLLRVDAKSGPKVQEQPPLAGPPGTTWIEQLLAEAVRRVTDEELPARPNDGCERCAYRRICPAQPEGRQVVE